MVVVLRRLRFGRHRAASGRVGINHRKALFLTISALVIAAIAAVVFLEGRRHGFEWAKARDVLAGLQAPWLAAAGAIALLSYVGRAVRWRILLAPVRAHPDMKGLVAATFIGFAAVTILGRAGELVRPYVIAMKEDVTFSSQLAAWVVERVFDLLIAILLFGFALSQLATENQKMDPGPGLTWVIRSGGWATLALSAACLGLLIAIRSFSVSSRNKLRQRLAFLSAHHLQRVERLITAFLEGAASTKSSWATIQILFWTILEWVLIAGCYACVIRSFGASLQFNWLDVVIFMGFVSIGSLFQIPGIGGGMQVVAVIALTEIFGVPLETATSVAVLIWLLTFVLVVPIGLGFALRDGITWAAVQAARKEALT